MSLTINVDSDGVVYDFDTQINLALERAGIEIDHSRWNKGLDQATFLEVFDRAILNGCFYMADPIDGAVEALNYLRDEGHRVRIVTSKILSDHRLTYLAQVDTLGWYKAQGLSDLEFVFTGGYSKQGYPADIVIDDKPTLEWAQDKAHLNILFDQPWNRHVTSAMTQKGVIRARNWPHVIRQIEGTVTVV